MSSHRNISDGSIEPRLLGHLQPIVNRLHARRYHRRSAAAWAVVFTVLLLAAGACIVLDAGVLATEIALGGVFIIGAFAGHFWARRAPGEPRLAAAIVESSHPELQQTLKTAVELEPGDKGAYSFLQYRVVEQALEHARANRWGRVPIRHERLPLVAHLGAAAACMLLFASIMNMPRSESGAIRLLPVTEITVAPGNAEVERGSAVVVTARFDGNVPDEATLVWSSSEGAGKRTGMARSLSDPVFATTLSAIDSDVSYQVVFRGEASEWFHLRVFELPELVQADATLDYPAYTGMERKTLEDVRRVSAVEGTAIEYRFRTNKPVRRAVLRTTSGGEIKLEPANDERTLLSAHFDLREPARYALHLQDDAGRANAWPDDIRIEAVPNRPPELQVEFPRGDQRVSALEEIAIRAQASDDFGLLDYGIGFSAGTEEPEIVSLKETGDERAWQAQFERFIALERRGVVPDDLVTWFAWARDHGPDGESRQTNSDLFFGEVRPFDEIFREQAEAAQQGQQQGGAGRQGEQLLEIQRQISLAIWNLRQSPTGGEQLKTDIGTITEAQSRARLQLQAIRNRLEADREKEAAALADEHMRKTLETLDFTGSSGNADTLDEAWRASQGAYQALLRLAPRETRVAQTRGGQSGQGGNNRNQRQLNQLRFRSNDDAYETESQAQALTSEEEREQMQTISRLRELARRQQDLNERLQELQTSLVAAQDEAERERIRRELKRLEEEQRRMVADLDELRQRMNRNASDPDSRQARERLDRTREDMRRSTEALEGGSISEALASGTRAQENLDQARDELRRESSSQFAEELREARREAREIAENQETIRQELDKLQGEGRSLDDSEARDQLAEQLDQNRGRLESLLEDLKQVTEASEGAEPGLHEQLYDLLRRNGQGATGERIETAAGFLRRGFLEQAREQQPAIQRSIEELRSGIERAAESVLGDEEAAMRFAQNELEDLSRALGGERPGGEENESPSPDSEYTESPEAREPGRGGARPSSPSSRSSPSLAEAGEGQRQPGEARGDRAGAARGGIDSSSAGDRAPESDLTEALQSFVDGGGGGGAWNGPLTGGDFNDWSDRLRTIESILELPGARERLS
ncbi:MAG: hypothetical protein ACREIA_10170, partial [Opitutaceae bacterium]